MQTQGVRRQGDSNQEVRGLEGGLCLEPGGEEERRKVEAGLDPADSSGTVGSPEAVVVVLMVPSRGERAGELGGAEAGSQVSLRGGGEHLPRAPGQLRLLPFPLQPVPLLAGLGR